MLRHHVVADEGEMVLVSDPTQDVYDKKSWTDEEQMIGSGFSGPWTELSGSYRLPSDLVPIANAFAARYLDGELLAGTVPTDRAAISASRASRFGTGRTSIGCRTSAPKSAGRSCDYWPPTRSSHRTMSSSCARRMKTGLQLSRRSRPQVTRSATCSLGTKAIDHGASADSGRMLQASRAARCTASRAGRHAPSSWVSARATTLDDLLTWQ